VTPFPHKKPKHYNFFADQMMMNDEFQSVAGKTTTDEELEEMLEQGSSAVFTQGVNQFI
jgi:rhamnogalacturonyl hydrolase YesR